ncbi:unnamed protein product [Linum tenue]|uniref:Uncharacterized protein n=1 Tax=Linum tenue TaxID=586396 RepID=A0AAV0KUX6_9ROSI|nr:unnamed protein product [Linum tenue]
MRAGYHIGQLHSTTLRGLQLERLLDYTPGEGHSESEGDFGLHTSEAIHGSAARGQEGSKAFPLAW